MQKQLVKVLNPFLHQQSSTPSLFCEQTHCVSKTGFGLSASLTSALQQLCLQVHMF